MSLGIERYLGRTLECDSCGQPHKVGTRAAAVGPRAIEEDLPAFLSAGVAADRVVILQDARTAVCAGDRTRAALAAAGISVPEAITLADDGDHPPGCDIPTIDGVAAALADVAPDAVVAVGSGTVTDVAKAAADRLSLPVVSVPTAASMNGYTSSIAAILEGGVKRTKPVRPVVGVFADPEVVRGAPGDMAPAGLGDLLSKSVCGADWMLSHLLQDAYWCALPGELVEAAESACIEQAAAIGAGDAAALGTLVEALLLSGISMVIAGSSAPASGGEHLISHLWDMRRHVDGRHLNHHGAQVGVGTLVTAALYELLMEHPVEAQVDPEALAASHPGWDAEAARITEVHGALAGEVLGCYRDKHRDRDAQLAFVTRVVGSWPAIRDRAGSIARPVAELRGALEAAGAATTAADLDVSADEMLETFLVARDIRARYTVLDLAWDLGLLGPLAEAALERSGVLG